MADQNTTATATLSAAFTTGTDGFLHPATPTLAIQDLPIPPGFTPDEPKIHLAIILGILIPVVVFFAGWGVFTAWAWRYHLVTIQIKQEVEVNEIWLDVISVTSSSPPSEPPELQDLSQTSHVSDPVDLVLETQEDDTADPGLEILAPAVEGVNGLNGSNMVVAGSSSHSALAKGIILRGTFSPTKTARSLSLPNGLKFSWCHVFAAYFSTVGVADSPDGSETGLALHFNRHGQDKYTISSDIVAYSFHGDVLNADGASEPAGSGASLTHGKFFSAKASPLKTADGEDVVVKYQILPEPRLELLPPNMVNDKTFVSANSSANEESVADSRPLESLIDATPRILARGPLIFKLMMQLAEQENDSNTSPPEQTGNGELLELGTIELRRLGGAVGHTIEDFHHDGFTEGTWLSSRGEYTRLRGVRQ